MKTGIVLITGFLQDYSKKSGLEAQQRIIEKKFRCRSDVETYEHLIWKDDMRAHAAMMKRDGVTQAIVFGYSFGGGYGTPRLCKALDNVGIKVIFAGLCDPVHRVSWLPAWKSLVPFTFRSITPWARVSIPSTVKDVRGIRQENNLPKAHPIKWNKHVWVLPLIERDDINHNNIDESPEWVDFVFDQLDRLLS